MSRIGNAVHVWWVRSYTITEIEPNQAVQASTPIHPAPPTPPHPQPTCLVCGEADDRHHARGLRIRRRLHALPPQLHQLDAVLKAQRAGVGEGGVLSQGQPAADVCQRGGLLPLLRLELLQGRQRGDVDGGLADGGQVQALLGACGSGWGWEVKGGGRVCVARGAGGRRLSAGVLQQAGQRPRYNNLSFPHTHVPTKRHTKTRTNK